MTIKMIAVIDMNFGIGRDDGGLIFNLPEYRKFFKDNTRDKRVLMGRKTLELINYDNLPDRDYYVLTNNDDVSFEGFTSMHSIQEVLHMSKTEDIVIVGGEDTYNQFFEHADELEIIHVHAVNSDAKYFFPDFSYKEWKLKKIDAVEERNDNASFSFASYKRK